MYTFYYNYDNFLISQLLHISGHWGPKYEGWNFNGGNYLFTTDTK